MWPFQRRTKTPPQIPSVTVPVDYPSGVAVRTEDGVYFIKGKSKFRIYSDRVLDSWSFDPLPGSTESLKRFKKAGTLGFRDGTLVRNIADYKTYLISENKKRHITSPDIFGRFGFDESKILMVSQEEINLHNDGEVLM